MEKQFSRNVKLGLMVLAGTAFLILSMYLIGNDQNLFRSTFTIHAEFRNVNGLIKGNAVRYAGIDVGTVQNVEIKADSLVTVTMVVQEKVRDFLKKNAIATIGSDGLIGNRIINILTVNIPSDKIEEGDFLETLQPLETDDMFRKLDKTNNDISIIAENIRILTDKMSNPKALIAILADTTIAQHIKDAVVNVRLTSQRSATISGDLSGIIKETKEGKGLIGGLLTDTSFTQTLNQTIINIRSVSDTLAEITGDFRYMSQSLKDGEGAIGAILMDTNIVPQLNQSLNNISKGTEGANELIEALKQSFLFRGYFKRKAKEQSKEKNNR